MAKKLSDQEFIERTRTGNRDRSLRYRERLIESGLRQMVGWVSRDLHQQISILALQHRVTKSEMVATLLDEGMQALLAKVGKAVPAATPDASTPGDREALAKIGHQWREEGLTLDAIATRFNEQGWTPATIPKEAGTQPRKDSPKEWTGKMISQLLSRDYPG